MHFKHLFAAAGACSLLCSAAVEATTISRNGVPIVTDNFNLISGGGNDSLDQNPVADVGSWITTPANSAEVAISNAATVGGPGPYEGNGYLRIANASGLGGSFDANVASITAGQTMTWSSRVYVPAVELTKSDEYQFITRTAPGGSISLFTTIRNGVVNYYNGTAYVPSGTTLVGDSWSLWTISYTVGSPTFSWLVNGVGNSAIPVFNNTVSIGNINFFGNQAGDATPLYFDSVVPEPASIGLLATGAALLVGRRRRAM